MILRLEGIRSALEANPSFRKGCIVDTNIIFAASFPLDPFNEWAENVFHTLHDLEIPLFTNINVRSEFIELNRRVLIPEGLVSFYDNAPFMLEGVIENRLKSLKTRADKSAKENRTFKLSDSEIKEFRRLLSDVRLPNGANGWETICKHYLQPYILNIWDDAIDTLRIEFIGTRTIDSKVLIEKDPTWQGMIDIVGKTGISVSDAMILNLFLQSTLPTIITADADVKDSVLTLLPPNKFVLAPN